jgi:hypothetical protein
MKFITAYKSVDISHMFQRNALIRRDLSAKDEKAKFSRGVCVPWCFAFGEEAPII